MVEILQIIPILMFSVILHECAHGWVALKFGDQTAKQLGRLTLNPLKHIDPFGTIVLPALFVIVPRILAYFGYTMSVVPLAWAKPVPIDYRNLPNPKRDMIWIAAAGPFVNICLAFIFSKLLIFAVTPGLYAFLRLAVFINLILAVFNLCPIPPLDGSRIVTGLLPMNLARSYVKLEPYGILIVIVLLNLGFLRFIFPLVMLLATMMGVDMRGM